MKENALKIWNDTWSQEQLSSEYAQKRIRSALSAKLTPIKVDSDDLYGYFQGSHGRYETWLDRCPCGDFIRGKQPCKHMYRLAMELGLFPGEFKTDTNMILPVLSEQMPLSDMIDLIETLSEASQCQLLKIVGSISNLNPVYHVRKNDDLDELLKTNLLEQSDKDIKLNNKYNRRNIHYYLHRKLGTESYYDPELDQFLTIPCTQTELPDDKITDELIKRGYYSRP